MRLWSRFKIKGRLGMDDYLILISAAATVPFLYLGLRLTEYGFGLNIWDIQPIDNLYEFSKAFYIDELVYNTILYTTKLSLLCFLAGIFPSRSFQNMVIATGVFALACYIVTIIVTAFQCLPVSYTWTNWDGEHKGRCTDLNAQTYAFAAFNMGCDIIILILPLKELSRLQVKGNQKIQLFIIFSFGIVVTTLSLIRIPSMASIGKTDNPTYDNIDIAIWSVWECELGMMCANLPAISHLFKKMFPNLLSSIVGKVSSARTTKHTGNSLGGSWARSHPGRSKTDDKEYYELDERSLIGKGPEGGSSACITATSA
ncbi:hypothetical protein NM208_g7937 [Fusarium decemcellulare]|uniref:Uncharacterized protein n=1 Tax=Fusarium decemcellulare TaxID=57161 RepID=A0ACC1S7F9_9HYPO|nr:hypothetical protein NM208_g7937 [Fusarium decemcellulare]